MASDSYRAHFRTITIISAGAALLAVLGYFLMKSDRKKPRRKPSISEFKESTEEVRIQKIQDDQITEVEIKTSHFAEEENVQNNLDKSLIEDEFHVVPEDTLETPINSETSSGFSSLHKFDEKKPDDNESSINNNFESELGNEINKILEKANLNENDTDNDIQNAYKESSLNSSSIISNSNKVIEVEAEVVEEEDKKEEYSIKKMSEKEIFVDNNHLKHQVKEDDNINSDNIPKSSENFSSSNLNNKDEISEEKLNLEHKDIPLENDSNKEINEIKINSNSSFEINDENKLNQNESIKKFELNSSSKSPSKSPNKRNKKKRNDSKRSRNSTSISSVSSSISSNAKNSPSKNNRNLKERAYLNTSKFLPINNELDTQNESNEDNTEDLVVYEFHFPRKLCGKLIGKNGVHVDYIRSKTQTQIAVRNDSKISDLQVVCVSGRISDVDKALDIIGHRFPSKIYPQISFKPITKPIVYRRFSKEKSNSPVDADQSKILVASTNFVELVNPKESGNNEPIEIQVTAIVNAGHIFVQLPKNSTYNDLQQLDKNMLDAYDNMSEIVPNMTEPIEYGTICAAPTSYGWHRAMITNYKSFDEVKLQLPDYNEMCGLATVKFLDYGGYLNIPVNQLRQLRSDFMLLPFQGIECYLDGCWNTNQGLIEEGRMYISQQIKDSITEALIVGYTEDGIPLIRLYISNNMVQKYCLNDEMSKLGLVLNYKNNSNELLDNNTSNYNQNVQNNLFNKEMNILTNEITSLNE